MLWGSKAPTRYPYYTINRSYIFVDEWKEHASSNGCYPIRTEQTVLLEKLPSGETPYVPPPPKLTREQKKAQKKEEAERKAKEELEKWKEKQKQKAQAKQKAEDTPSLVGEDVERKLPPFDLRDLPKAMRKAGYLVTAELLEKWFRGDAYRIPTDKDKRKHELLTGLIRVERELVTLKWVLKFGSMKDKLDSLLTEGLVENTIVDKKNPITDRNVLDRGVYHKDAIAKARKAIEAKIKQDWEEDRTSNFSFSTKMDVLDFPKFDDKWQFQFIQIDATDTITGITTIPTDLTLSVGNCNLYAAVGVVIVTGNKYYEYDNKTSKKRRCFEPVAEMTHVYVYLKDDFEVNPKDKEVRSQYLGHWNQNGVIISELAFISDRWRKNTSEPFRNYPIWGKGTPYPVYTGKDSKAQQDEEIYYPIYNETFEAWRQKHRHGQDFLTITEPELFKLKKPMVFKLDKLCSPWGAK
jgi:hypothetical protein